MKIQIINSAYFTNKPKLILEKKGNLSCLQVFEDGSKKEFFNGKLEKETMPDGSFKIYDGCGHLLCERFSNGLERGYNGTGRLVYETYPDGSSVSWHRNGGKICLKKNSDGSSEFYNGDGTLFIKRDESGKIIYQSENDYYE